MAKRKTEKSIEAQEDEQNQENSRHYLVFISHDSKDAEIAEAFSKLLKNVSTGVLKSFRSSDRKGSQGIEYGVEWYPEIMKKLNESSDVVCLLTKNSVNRPWILYEAGVAKGKLSTPLLGVAIGIPLNKANNGPFAQFQNCSDDIDSLTKLVIQLVKKIPDSEPEEAIIKEQVKIFKIDLEKILSKASSKNQKDTPEELVEDASVAKLFEEIKIMFQDLPSKVDRRLDSKRTVIRNMKFHPRMVDELVHYIGSEDPYTGALIALSFVKEDFPWLYDLGFDTIKTLKTSKSPETKQKAIRNFMHILEFSFEHPMMREFLGDTKESHFLLRDVHHTLMKSFERCM